MTSTVQGQIRTSNRLESKSGTDEKSSARKSQAVKARRAFQEKPEQIWLHSSKGALHWSSRIEDATIFRSIAEVAWVVLSVNINDIRAWSELYGLVPTLALATLGRKTIWKMQAELLGRTVRPSRLCSGGPDNPSDPGGGGGHDPGGPYLHDRSNALAEEEYKRTVEAESGRINVSGAIIAQIAVTALSLPSLSQTHWVARSSWLFSLVSSLLAVYYANNQAGRVAYLWLGDRLRAWIRGHSKSFDDYIREDGVQGSKLAQLLVRSLIPAPSSVLIASAPGVLLSASLYFLIIGFGIYLGFMWTRTLDDLAGPDDYRDVFIVYLVSLSFCYGLYSMSDAAHNRRLTDTVRGTIQNSLKNPITRLEMSEQTEEQNQQLLSKQSSCCRQMLDQLEETQILMNSTMWEDRSDGRTPLSWAAERGKKLTVLALLGKTRGNIDAQDHFGRTPLLWAAANGHEAVVRELLSQNANFTIEDRDGQTALDLARRNEHKSVMALLHSSMQPVSANEHSE